jgi:hypothetical protein
VEERNSSSSCVSVVTQTPKLASLRGNINIAIKGRPAGVESMYRRVTKAIRQLSGQLPLLSEVGLEIWPSLFGSSIHGITWPGLVPRS